MQSKFIKNYLYNTIYQVLVVIVPLITAPYISRVLGAENVGIFSYTSSIVSYFSIFAVLGTNMYGIRETAYHQHDRRGISVIFGEVQCLKLILTAAVLPCYLLYLSLCHEYNEISIIHGIVLLYSFFDISWFFQGLEEFGITVFRNMVAKVLGVILIFAFVKTKEDLALYTAIQVIVILVGNISLWFYLPGRLMRISIREIRPFDNIRGILELFIPVVAIQIYNILDKSMLGIIAKDMSENGYYEQTTRIISICMLLITSLGSVLNPHISAEYAKGSIENIGSTVTKAFEFIILISCPLCVGIIAVSDYFVPWFFGDGYDKVALLMKIYSLVILIIPLSNMAGMGVLSPTKQHNKGTLAVIVGAAVNFVLNCILIPMCSSVGAAVATIAAETAVTALHLFFIRKNIRLKHVFAFLLKDLAAAVIMGFCIIAFGMLMDRYGFNNILITLLQTVLGAVIYFAIIWFIVKDKLFKQLVNKITAQLFHK